jgi:hypothetical protein
LKREEKKRRRGERKTDMILIHRNHFIDDRVSLTQKKGRKRKKERDTRGKLKERGR